MPCFGTNCGGHDHLEWLVGMDGLRTLLRRRRKRRRAKRFRRSIGALFVLIAVLVPVTAQSDDDMPRHPAVVEQWRPLVEQYWSAAGYGDEVEYALMILYAESAGNPDAQHPGSKASGLFQHLPKYWAERSTAAGWGGASIWDPEANIAVAAWLRATNQRHGWQHWTPTHTWYPVGSYGPDTRWDPNRKRYVNLGGGKVGRGNVFGPKSPRTPDPSISVTKILQGDGEVVAGDTLTWKYVVENSGELTLYEVYVDDEALGEAWCPEERLDPGDSMKCWGEETARRGDQESTAWAYAWTGDGVEAVAQSTSGYSAARRAATREASSRTEEPPAASNRAEDAGAGASDGSDPDDQSSETREPASESTAVSASADGSIALAMFVDGHPADDPDDPVDIDPGDQVFYVIVNNGILPLFDVYLWDSDLKHVRCPLDELEPGESMVCDAWPEFPADGKMKAWATALTEDGTEVKDSDGIAYRLGDA